MNNYTLFPLYTLQPYIQVQTHSNRITMTLYFTPEIYKVIQEIKGTKIQPLLTVIEPYRVVPTAIIFSNNLFTIFPSLSK